MLTFLSITVIVAIVLLVSDAGRASAYGGPITVPGSTTACSATMESTVIYGTGVFHTYANTANTSGCVDVRVRIKYDATHFGAWASGGSGTARVSTTAQAIGGSHLRCTTCTSYAT